MNKARGRSVFVCQQCSYESPKALGRCPHCDNWNTFVEEVRSPVVETSRLDRQVSSRPVPLSQVPIHDFSRVKVSMDEFNRVLGGGIVPGSGVLVGGDPGIGKSTLLLQISAQIASSSGMVLYVSGEESAQQIKLRADRLGIREDRLYLLAENDLDEIVEHIRQLRPAMVVVDSIQTITSAALASAAGSVSQVKECANMLVRTAKGTNVPVFLVGHVTKEGAIAGPRVLEHVVDAVLYLEGDQLQQYRLLRGVKNRYGSTNEVGVFEMGSDGLVEVQNPSESFLSERPEGSPGSTVAVTLEGTRPLLVEVQALTSYSTLNVPRRVGNGIDFSRLLMLVAVLTKRVGLPLSDQDVYVNVVGGLKVTEPAIDLAVAVAIASSLKDIPVSEQLAFVGEVGLAGELRSVRQLERRLQESAKLGFNSCIYPRTYRKPDVPGSFQAVPSASVRETLSLALLGEPLSKTRKAARSAAREVELAGEDRG